MLNTPPFLIGAALAFWGWRTGWWWLALPLAAIFEASRLVKARWEFTDKEYSRVFDVCTLLFGGAVVYLRFADNIERAGFALVQWSPAIFALMVLVQAYGNQEKISYAVFSWFLRLRRGKGETIKGGLNVAWPYFAICLLAAGGTNNNDPTFYAALVVLVGWAAWSTRVRRYTAPVWAACFLAAAAAGWVGQAGWSRMQAALVPYFGELFARFAAKDFDAQHARTSMGEISAQKKSGRIVWRVKAEQGKVPQLIRQATYESFTGNMWSSATRDFVSVSPDLDTTTWTLGPEQSITGAARISGYLRGGKGLLALPMGAGRLRDLPVGAVEQTGLAATRVSDGPGVVSYVAEFHPGKPLDALPTALDWKVPDIEEPAIKEVIAQLKPASTNATDLARAVEQFFTANFHYTLYNPANGKVQGTPLAHFLRTTRAGHCEYFASATVLLLRQLGIPARYAVGWVVDEQKNDTYVVRDRHAHAWTVAFIDGAWRELDTTPGTWLEMEKEGASKFEAISDWWQDVKFKFAEWRWLGQKGTWREIAPWLVIPLSAILLWRVFFGRKRTRNKNGRAGKESFQGDDSEFYALEARLAAAGHVRDAAETPEQWLIRLRKEGLDHPSLPALIDLHYRYRFDPRGITATDRKLLKELAQVEFPERN